MKATYKSGGVSQVTNGWWKCLKPNKDIACNDNANALKKTSFAEILSSLRNKLEIEFSSIIYNNQMQYKDIPHQIMIEEDISSEIKRDVSYWHTSNGRPLFVSVQRNPTVEGHGDPELVRSKWKKQVEIATALAKGVAGILRIDLCPSEKSVLIPHHFVPRVLVYILVLPMASYTCCTATSQLVESIIHDESWVLIQSDDSRLQDDDRDKNCLDAFLKEATASLRCIVAPSLDTIKTASGFKVFSDATVSTFNTVMDHVDYGRSINLLLLIVILTRMDIGTKH
eukprot:scaffold14574_cov38-Cyclotella_meneghiniana.AAC.4